MKRQEIQFRRWKRAFVITILFLAGFHSQAQPLNQWIDSIRTVYKMPALAYAVVTSDSALTMNVQGVRSIRKKQAVTLNDRFRIGSNTKTITAYMAALMVRNGKIKYETRFFDLFPELKGQSRPAYHDLTLQDLLTFRAPLISWTYTNERPRITDITGTPKQQRYLFMTWVLAQPPDTAQRPFHWSNPSYVAAGMMLEKASGKIFEQIVHDLNVSLGTDFQFGQPNFGDPNQPWGHNETLQPEAPANNPRLNWLSSAGNINASLPDHVKFIQAILLGLQGKSTALSKEECTSMLFGLPQFSYGWLAEIDPKTQLKYAYHRGNPGTFLSLVYICPQTNLAYILFTNVQSDLAEQGLNLLFERLKNDYKL